MHVGLIGERWRKRPKEEESVFSFYCSLAFLLHIYVLENRSNVAKIRNSLEAVYQTLSTGRSVKLSFKLVLSQFS